MAGSEKGGFAQAEHGHFQGKNYILTPIRRNKPENREALLERIEGFEESLDKLKGLIAEGRREALERELALVRDRRAAMG